MKLFAIIVLWIACVLFFMAGANVLASSQSGIHEIYGAILWLAAVNCFGLSFIIAGVFHSTSSGDTKKCPDCKSNIPADASVCKYCRCEMGGVKKNMKKCPDCKSDIPADASVCKYCRCQVGKIMKICLDCRADIPADASVCMYCQRKIR